MLEQFRYLAECVRRQDGEVLLYDNTAVEMIPRLIYRNLGSFSFPKLRFRSAEESGARRRGRDL